MNERVSALSLIFYVCVCTKWFIFALCILWAYLQQLTTRNGIYPFLFIRNKSVGLHYGRLSVQKVSRITYRTANHWIYPYATRIYSMNETVYTMFGELVASVWPFFGLSYAPKSFALLQLWCRSSALLEFYSASKY